MNKDDLIKKLEELNFPEIEPANHKRRLKMALLASGNFKKRRFSDFIPLRKILQELLMPERRFAFIGSLMGVAVIAIVVGTMLFSMKSMPVSAQQIASKSYQTVAGLSLDEQELLTKTIKINDPLKLLDEARNAKDLKVSNYTEFTSQNPDIQLSPIPSFDWNKVQFLEFTESEGARVLLAVDPGTNLPIFVSMSISSGDDHFGAASFSISKFDGAAGTETETGVVTTTGCVSVDESGTITFNGREYLVPEEARGSTFKVEEKGEDLYINGVKAIAK
jgi:hypothetical protein